MAMAASWVDIELLDELLIGQNRVTLTIQPT